MNDPRLVEEALIRIFPKGINVENLELAARIKTVLQDLLIAKPGDPTKFKPRDEFEALLIKGATSVELRNAEMKRTGEEMTAAQVRNRIAKLRDRGAEIVTESTGENNHGVGRGVSKYTMIKPPGDK